MSTPARLELAQRVDPSGRTVVSMRGQLDIATAEEAYAGLHDAIRRARGSVEVDATGLSFCDAAGLRVFIWAVRDARAERRQLALTAAGPSLLRMIRITGLHRAYPELIPLWAA